MQPKWNWQEPKRIRKLTTVEDYIFWSYAMLSVSRRAMAASLKPKQSLFTDGRTKAANILMSKYQNKELNISSFERDDRLAQDGNFICSHLGCKIEKWHWDHLIPRSRLGAECIAYNQVRSCIRCNTSRGNKDLMGWHRTNNTFPSLGILRRYLKLCYFYAEHNKLLEKCAQTAVANGLPFDPRLLPRKFPPIGDLVWDYAHQKK
jgi:hypothetical protein